MYLLIFHTVTKYEIPIPNENISDLRWLCVCTMYVIYELLFVIYKLEIHEDNGEICKNVNLQDFQCLRQFQTFCSYIQWHDWGWIKSIFGVQRVLDQSPRVLHSNNIVSASYIFFRTKVATSKPKDWCHIDWCWARDYKSTSLIPSSQGSELQSSYASGRVLGLHSEGSTNRSFWKHNTSRFLWPPPHNAEHCKEISRNTVKWCHDPSVFPDSKSAQCLLI